MPLFVSAVSLVLLVYCVVDLVTTPSAVVRTLPKPLWFAVILLPVFGPAAWLLAGRPQPGAGRSVPKLLPDAAPQSRTPDDDEEFLRQLRRRAEEQRREAEMQRRRESDPRDEDRPA